MSIRLVAHCPQKAKGLNNLNTIHKKTSYVEPQVQWLKIEEVQNQGLGTNPAPEASCPKVASHQE